MRGDFLAARVLFLCAAGALGCARGGDTVVRDMGGGGSSDTGSSDGGSSDTGSSDGGRVSGDSGDRADAAAHDAGVPADSPMSSTADTGGRDAGGRDAGRDTGSAMGGLDPRLDVPPASNEVCTSPGSLSECTGIAVCRFFSATEGRCESCSSSCGNLFAPCTSGDQCDILFVCFEGACTNFCTLGTSECGPPSDCIDIGHPTRGACRPR